MQKTSTQKNINKVLKGLKTFGVIVEIDNKTYEVLGVRYPEKASALDYPLG